MKIHKITTSGQISLPAAVRNRWRTRSVALDDQGDFVVVRPVPDDPIGAARGTLGGKLRSTTSLRERARKDEAAAARRR